MAAPSIPISPKPTNSNSKSSVSQNAGSPENQGNKAVRPDAYVQRGLLAGYQGRSTWLFYQSELRSECEDHKRLYYLIFTPDYPAFKGRHVRCGMRLVNALPAGIASCADVRPDLAVFSSRPNKPAPCDKTLGKQAGSLAIPPDDLQQIAAPPPEHEQVERNTGLRPKPSRPGPPASLNPRRMSVTPADSHTRVLPGAGLQDVGQRVRRKSRWTGQRRDGRLRHVAYPFLC